MIRYPNQGYFTLSELQENKAFARNMLMTMNAFNEDLERKRHKVYPRYYLVTKECEDKDDLFYFQIRKVERKDELQDGNGV